MNFHPLLELKTMKLHALFRPIGFHASIALLPNAAWFVRLEEHIFKFLIEERKH